MTKKKPEAQIFRKPIHDSATRKVSVHPQLLAGSERPDGARASKVADDAAESPETREIVVPERTPAGELYDDLFGDMFDEDDEDA